MIAKKMAIQLWGLTKPLTAFSPTTHTNTITLKSGMAGGDTFPSLGQVGCWLVNFWGIATSAKRETDWVDKNLTIVPVISVHWTLGDKALSYAFNQPP